MNRHWNMDKSSSSLEHLWQLRRRDLTTVYIVSTDKWGEIQGAFDEDGHLLGYWYDNDACFRTEYFRDFLGKVGIEVLDNHDSKLEKKLIKRAKKDN